MKKNDVFPLTIEDMAVGGQGIGHEGGMTFFVSGAVLGDQVLARATKLKKSYGYARLEEILAPSDYRVPEACPIARRCGGCQLQALSYDRQKRWKEERVKGDLVRIGAFDPDYIEGITEPILGMEDPFRYRNKAQFPLGEDKEGRMISGFYAARSHRIVPVADCLLGAAENQEILTIIKDYMRRCGVKPYHEADGLGLIRHVLIRKAFATGQIMVCLVINGRTLPRQQDLIRELRRIEGMTSISLNINCRKTNVIMGDETCCIWGEDRILDYIGEVSFAISPRSFYQVNPYQTKRLYEKALSYADLKGDECVWDLYCGIGTISLFLAGKAGQVFGVEVIPEAIEDARANARRNGIGNAHFFVGRAEEVLPDFYEGKIKLDGGPAEREARHPDVIVVDPPRKGCDELCLQTMLKMRPNRIVYVSCDPATLARDLRVLADGGYALRGVCPVDQFPMTTHVETVVWMSRAEWHHSSCEEKFDLLR